jgi:ornithine carbamoyltransferase
MTKHFLSIESMSDDELAVIYDRALAPIDDTTLSGQGVAYVFTLASLRTKASCATSTHDLGGYAAFFSDAEIGLDTRESAEDVGRTLASQFALAGMRVRDHGVFDRIAAATQDQLRLINLLSNKAHPTQAIADVLTLAEHFGDGDLASLRGRTVAYVGDATNVTRSLAVALLRLGANVRVGAPAGYQLTPGDVEDPSAVVGGGTLTLVENVADAVANVDAIYTDTWISMGLEHEADQRLRNLGAFQVNGEVLNLASPDCVVLHCLPAHRGEEVTDDVLDGPHSLIWRQTHHRRSAMVGVLRWMKETE